MRRFATSLLDADPPPRQGFPDMPRASGLAPAVRRTVAPAIWALSAYRGTALLLATTAAVGLAAVLPVTSLATWGAGRFATRLDLAPLSGGDLGMGWSALASSPTATRHAALLVLVRLLLGVATGVLAVAGLTVVSLSAARAAARAPEVRVRRAVGASRREVLGAALLESAAITAAALVPGALAGVAAGRLATAAWPGTADAGTTGLDIVAAVALAAGIVLGGALPLLFPRRTAPLPGPTGKPLALVVPALQLGLSLTVLAAAALLAREAGRLIVPAATTAGGGEVFSVTAPESPPAWRSAQYASLLHRLGNEPRFEAVSLTSPGTLAGLGMVDAVTSDCGACKVGDVYVTWLTRYAVHYLVSADTFRTLGMKVVAGRGITDADGWAAPRVAVVNRYTAARNFEGGEAVGKRIWIGRTPGEWYTVVGVVADRAPPGFGGGLQPRNAVYLSALQHPARSLDLLVRAPGDTGMIAAVERDLRDTLGPSDAPVGHVSETRVLAAEAGPLRWFGKMFGMEGWVILTLATLGTFAVMRLWVASLAHELGVRRAVGARRRHILGFVLARALGVALGGVAIGLWAGLILWDILTAVAAGVPAWDLRLALRFAPLLAGAALAGALFPAWQAARTAPTKLVATEQ